jgi:hypothetical protein
MNQKVPKRIPMIRIDISARPRSLVSTLSPSSWHTHQNNPTNRPGIFKKRGSTYIYFILLLKLGWIVSGYQRKMYITRAQLRLAKTGQAPAWIWARAEAESKGCVREIGEPGVGKGEEAARERVRWGWIDSLARASMTRAKT